MATDLLVVGLGNPGRGVRDARATTSARRSSRSSRRGTAGGCARARSPRSSTRSARRSPTRARGADHVHERLRPSRSARSSRRFGVEPDHLVIVHDELDLPPAVLKVKVGGGLAGHNGLRSIEQHLQVRRVPPRAHRRREAVVEGAGRRPRAQPLRQARTRRDRRHPRRSGRRGRADPRPTASTPP